MSIHSAFCADIGSITGNKFGWASITNGKLKSGSSIESFAEEIATAINKGNKVSIGFECPLFVPVREKPETVASARSGEGNRSWSAGAGTGALATGLVEVLWIMRKVNSILGYAPKPTFDWPEFLDSNTVFIWEAFVTARAKGLDHHHDAEIAVKTFLDSLDDLQTASAINEPHVMSLVAACALRAEWTSDIRMLWKPCLVIKRK